MFCIEVSKETKISDTMVLLRLFDYQGALTVRYHRLRSFYRRRLFAAYNRSLQFLHIMEQLQVLLMTENGLQN